MPATSFGPFGGNRLASLAQIVQLKVRRSRCWLAKKAGLLAALSNNRPQGLVDRRIDGLDADVAGAARAAGAIEQMVDVVAREVGSRGLRSVDVV